MNPPSPKTPEEIEKQAEATKNEGNSFYKQSNFKQAIEKYEEAVQQLPENHLRRAVYLCNKAMCSLKLEEPGQALKDAERAIAIDPKNLKAYYRKAVSFYAMNKLKLAIEALKEITNKLKIRTNKDVNDKLKLLKKMLKERAFLKAIEYEDETQQLDANTLNVPTSYQGPRLDDRVGLSHDWVMKLIEYLKDQKKLHKKFVWIMIKRMTAVLDSEPNLNFLKVVDGQETEEVVEGASVPEELDYSWKYKEYDDVRYTLPQITVCGDIHGKFRLLCGFFGGIYMIGGFYFFDCLWVRLGCKFFFGFLRIFHLLYCGGEFDCSC